MDLTRRQGAAESRARIHFKLDWKSSTIVEHRSRTGPEAPPGERCKKERSPLANGSILGAKSEEERENASVVFLKNFSRGFDLILGCPGEPKRRRKAPRRLQKVSLSQGGFPALCLDDFWTVFGARGPHESMRIVFFVHFALFRKSWKNVRKSSPK